MTNQSDIHDKTLRVAWWTLAVIVFGVTVAIRIRLLGIPLERDEGEYAYAGQLILQGIPPYKLAYNMKFPGNVCRLRRDYVNLWTNNHWNSFGFAPGQCCHNRADFLTGATPDELDGGNRRSNHICRSLHESIRPGVSFSRHEFCDGIRSRWDVADSQGL